MRIIALKVYKYDELSLKNQEKIRDRFRETQCEYDWWEFVYEDATTIGKILGIAIEDIYFSGFASQGDGCCFIGSYEFNPNWEKDLKAYAPQDEQLHEIGSALADCQSGDVLLEAKITKADHHYSHEGTVHIDVYDSEDSHEVDDPGISEALRDFMRWIYKQLEAEYEYQMSDEAVEETIKANEYEFCEGDLKIWHGE